MNPHDRDPRRIPPAGAGRAGRVGAALLLPILLLSGAPAQQPGRAGKAPAPPKKDGWLRENWVMAVVNDKVITWRDVRSRIPLTAVEIWSSPERLLKEEDRILRELTSSLLLEEGLYTLPQPPESLDFFIEKLVRREMEQNVEAAGGMEPYLEDLKKMGLTYQEKEKELRERFKKMVFLSEKVGRAFQGSRALLQVRPQEMLQLYRSPAWKDRRVRPAWCVAQVFLVPQEKKGVIPALRKLLEKAGPKPWKGKLPEGVIANEMLVLDCPSLQVGWAVGGLPLEPWERDLPPWSREDLNPRVAAFLFGKGPVPRVSPPLPSAEGFQVVRLIRFHPRETLAFTDPAVQEELRARILEWKHRLARFELLQKLWRRARIWPARLKRLGPPGVPSPWE